MKRGLSWVLVLVVVAGLGLVFLQQDDPAGPGGLASTRSDVAEGQPAIEEVLFSERAGTNDAIATAESADAVIAQIDASSLEAVLGLNSEAVAQSRMEFPALLARLRAGDRDAAREFGARRLRCQQSLAGTVMEGLLRYGSEEALLKHAPSYINVRRSDGSAAFEADYLRRMLMDDIAEFRSQMPGCIPYYLEAVDTLRDELERLAEQGNAAARMAYALWPLHRDHTINPEAMIDPEAIRYWEVRALEFTLANLEAGEQLGFEAMALSHATGRLFTPEHQLTATTFTVAAARCGFPVSEEERLMLVVLARRHGYHTLPEAFIEVLIKGSEDLRQYCRSGTWWTREQVLTFVATVFAT